VWTKKSPMPESVTDRPTSAHEKVFLLSKSARYFYDAEAVREDVNPNNDGSCSVVERAGGTAFDAAGKPIGARRKYETIKGANLRNVWHLGPEPFPEAHFATFPTEIPRRAILAGTSEKGCCAKCGAPWVREVERKDQGYDGSRYGKRVVGASGGAKTGGTDRSTLGSSNGKLTGKSETTGWSPSCGCETGIVPCTVLDPFLGSGTTALVSDRLGRDCIGIELNPAYSAMARRRIEDDAGLFAAVDGE
jgi:hypothetical protein